MRQYLSFLCLATLLMSQVAYAAPPPGSEGATTPLPTATFDPNGMLWTGDHWVCPRGTVDGYALTKEAFPREYDAPAEFVSCTNMPVFVGISTMGLGWSSAPYQMKQLYITRTSTGTVGTMYLYLFTSPEGNTLFPLSPSSAWTTGAPPASSSPDTLMTSIPAGTSATYNMVIDIPQSLYTGKFLFLGAARDSASGSTQKLTVAWSGRRF